MAGKIIVLLLRLIVAGVFLAAGVMKIWDGLKRLELKASAFSVKRWFPTMNWLPMTCCSELLEIRSGEEISTMRDPPAAGVAVPPAEAGSTATCLLSGATAPQAATARKRRPRSSAGGSGACTREAG